MRVSVPPALSYLWLIRRILQSHVCVLQTVLDLLGRYNVYVLADGVSSANKEEVPIALAEMRQAGARITTSDGLAFRLMGNHHFLFLANHVLTPRLADASGPKFKAFSGVIKEELNHTRGAVTKLIPYKSAL